MPPIADSLEFYVDSVVFNHCIKFCNVNPHFARMYAHVLTRGRPSCLMMHSLYSTHVITTDRLH